MIVRKLMENRARQLRERADSLSQHYTGSRRIQEDEARRAKDPAIRFLWRKIRPLATTLIELYIDLIRLRSETLTYLEIDATLYLQRFLR